MSIHKKALVRTSYSSELIYQLGLVSSN
uniref:Uncharacterized protein n=1 Tax=Arundo donax TaxID=35708 RepID=A0A0A9GT09_ARUDO